MPVRRIAASLALLLAACTSPDRAPAAPGSAAPAPPPPEPAPLDASANAPPPAAAPLSAPEAPEPPVARDLEAIDDLARGAIERGELAGAVVEVIRGDAVAFRRAYGARIIAPDLVPMTADAIFDLASITKAVCTGPAIVLLAEQKKLRIGDRVSRYLPGFAQNGKDEVTLEQLLLHTSGLPADNAVSDYAGGREKALARIFALPLEADPGTRFEYSDLGYILLGAVVEKVSGEPLDAFVREHFYAPLGMKETTFNPGAALAARAAPTEESEGALLQGRVHDPRARRLGGVAGHAGLFSTADDLGRFARMLLAGGELDGTRVLGAAAVKQMTLPRALPDGGKRGLGWDIQTRFSGNKGDLRGGFGHTGFTGPSIWIDPGSRAAVIVLASRLYPEGKGDSRRLRREVASLVAHSIASPRAVAGPPSTSAVLTGIDVLERDGFRPLAGRHVGLVTHAAAVDRRGTSTLDRLRSAPGVHLVAVFSPEHGLRGDQDRPVASGRDEQSGLPVYSLYGERTRPSDAELEGIDTLVYDLQDAGARFYTYSSTLGQLLEVAAQKKIKVVVLDRPNPLGGLRVEGPMLDADRTSFIGYHPLPVRHGMTVGELARLYNQERSLGADLEVIKLEGWSRGETWDRTGLAWHNPSPNLRSFPEAQLYPGVALLEATNLSVGRGTDRPFERVGAPWIEGSRLAGALRAAGLPGVTFSATSFTPSSSTFAGKACGGVEIRIDDPARFDPVRTGLRIAVELRRLYPGEWQSKGLLLLLGNQAAYSVIENGGSVESAVAGWQAGLAAFATVREKYLLYP